MERVIHLSSDENDIILDSFAGSGTTAAVGIRWGVDGLSLVIMLKHTSHHGLKVVNGEDPGGVTEATGWKGGGGYRLSPCASL